MRSRRWLIAGAAVLLAATAALFIAGRVGGPGGASATGAPPGATVHPADFRPLSSEQVAALPEARYNAVIPGLLAYASAEVPPASRHAYAISADIPIYDDARTPVARFAFTNFAGRPTVIVPVRIDGPWALVMTPARQKLPSQAGGAAPAQTAGWVRTDALHRTTDLTRKIVVSTGEQKLLVEGLDGSVVQSFDVAVGAPGTPTPTGVTGYLEERYLDAQQGQTEHAIQLTSLHSSAQDEPFDGEDGGLIGMHYFAAHTGSISHGCIRLSSDAIAAVDALPLGTSVTIVP
ncbi:L,D-transpeptidase [Leifsonia xyli]|uniref:L,D-transpeptidase n=1 Tax=Leifsonia xyli TaxID=1575 RepID=UPI003D66A7F8